MSAGRPPALVLDSASLYYRSFHALPQSMTAPDGTPHNAVRGFLSTITRLVDAHSPARVIPAWDDDWRPRWRVDLIPSYKAHRVDDESGGESEPESLGVQAEGIAALLASMGMPPVGRAGFEADDVIASLAEQLAGPVIVVSGDRDLVQVVSDRTRLLLTVNGGMDKWPLLEEGAVLERFGVTSERYVDLAVLRGDPSDGLPGVPGIGAKTAVALVSSFDGLEGIIDAAHKTPDVRPMTPRLAGAITQAEEIVRRARTVATAVTDLDVLDSGEPTPDADRCAELAARWGVQRQVDALLASIARAKAQTADE